MDFSLLKTLLPVVIFGVGALIVAVRLQSEVKGLKRDVRDLEKKEAYIRVVKLEVEMEVARESIGDLWNKMDEMRERFNGGTK
jgi:hypothetical protein